MENNTLPQVDMRKLRTFFWPVFVTACALQKTVSALADEEHAYLATGISAVSLVLFGMLFIVSARALDKLIKINLVKMMDSPAPLMEQVVYATLSTFVPASLSAKLLDEKNPPYPLSSFTTFSAYAIMSVFVTSMMAGAIYHSMLALQQANNRPGTQQPQQRP